MYENLRKTRKKKKIRVCKIIEELALKTEGAYYKKENQIIPITVEEGKKLSSMMDTSMDELFK